MSDKLLRRVWHHDWPDRRRAAQIAFTPAGDRVAVGSSFELAIDEDSIGALVLYDATSGEVLHQIADNWVVGPIAFSPDGHRLSTAELGVLGGVTQQRVRVLDADTFVERASFPMDFGNQTPVFSPDGRTCLNLGFRFSAFDLSGGTPRWQAEPSVEGTSVAWSPDGTSVAFGSILDGSTALAVVDGQAGTTRVLTPAPGRVDVVTYSPDGHRIVAGAQVSPGYALCVFDAGSGAQLWEVREKNADRISSIAVSDDGRWVAALGVVDNPDGAVLGVYDLAAGRPRYPSTKLEAFSFAAGPLRYSPTLRHIVVQGGKGAIVIDARTGLEYARTGPEDVSAALAPDGGALVAGFRTLVQGRSFVEKYDLGIEVCRHATGAKPTTVAAPVPGTSLVAVADTGGTVSVVDGASGVALARKPVPGTISSIVFADQGQAVAAGGSDGVRLFSIVGTRSWKVDTIGAVNALAVAGEAGDRIATAAGRTVRLLNSADGSSRWPSPNTHPQTVTRIAASVDGRWIATGCLDRNTRILDAATGTETFRVEGDGRVQALAFSPDGALLATANEDGDVILIDPATASERGRIKRTFGCSHVAFSVDAALLAAGYDDNAVAIFDISASGFPPPKLRELACAAPVSGIAFSSAQQTIAVATAGAPAVLYDARTGIELVRILQPAPVTHFAFSGDGALLATTSDDGVVRVWTSGS